jgi:heat shock protein HslJ
MKPTDLDDGAPIEPDDALLARVHSRSNSFRRRRSTQQLTGVTMVIVVLALAGGIAWSRRDATNGRRIGPAPLATTTTVAPPTTVNSLLGTWVPQAIAESPPLAGVPPEVGEQHLQFSRGNHWSGYDGCNNFRGTYQLGSGGAFSLSIASQSLVACPSGLPTLKSLASATRIELHDVSLTFLGRNGRVIARYERPVITPVHPFGLTLAPDGTLYIVDTGRDQILKQLAGGPFEVVAGDGQQGSAGDGGPATKAELRLSGFSGIVVSSTGTLYFGDSGNSRVRAVTPNGNIETVAGNGNDGMLLGSSPPLEAAIGQVSGLAIAPNGDLYIAAANMLRLTPAGRLEWVAGNRGPLPACGTIECNPAGEVDFTEPDQLAFDGAGDLFVSDSNGYGLYEIAANGALSYLGQFRGDGAPGALAPAPDGTVVEAWRFALTRRTASGTTTQIAANLDAPLGRESKVGRPRNFFIGGDGVAVAANGDIYLDTNSGNTFTSVSALLRVETNGHVTALWKSKPEPG